VPAVGEEVGAADVEALGCKTEDMELLGSAAPFAVSALTENGGSVGGFGRSVMFTSLFAADTEVEAS